MKKTRHILKRAFCFRKGLRWWSPSMACLYISWAAILSWVRRHFAAAQTKGQCDIHLPAIARHLPATWTRLMKAGPHASAAHFRVTGAAARERQRFLREIDCVSTPKPVRGRRRILWLVAFWHVFENPSQNITLQDVTRFLRRGARFNLHSANGSARPPFVRDYHSETRPNPRKMADLIKRALAFHRMYGFYRRTGRMHVDSLATNTSRWSDFTQLCASSLVRLSSLYVKLFWTIPSYYINLEIGFKKRGVGALRNK